MKNISLKIDWRTYRTAFTAYSALLILLAVLPINAEGSSINNTYVVNVRLDYLLHFAVFVPWVVLLRMVVKESFSTKPAFVFGMILMGLGFALFNEAIQYVLPYRAFNVNDMLANGLGVVLGSLLFLLKFNH